MVYSTASDIPDADLWQRLRQGDRAAFDVVFHRYIYLLYHYGHKITADKMVVEDCVQDLFTNLWEKRNQLGSTTSVKYYLFASLRRRLIRRLNQENRRSVPPDPEFAFVKSPEACIVEQQQTKEQLDKLQQVLGRLTKRQKEAIYLKFYSQLSYDEIARTMGLNKRTVYNLVSQAIETMRRDLSRNAPLEFVACLLPLLIGVMTSFA